MKKTIVLMLAAVLSMSVCACGQQPVETTLPAVTIAPLETIPETTVPQTTAPEPTRYEPPAGFLNLNDILEGTDISLSVAETEIVLHEDGLTVSLSRKSRLVYRDGYVMAVMPYVAICRDEGVFIHEKFFRSFFCSENSDMVSLFHGVFFFPEEYLMLIDHPDGSVFQQKLAAEIMLPTSMGIEDIHVDLNRVFQYRPLSDYPSVLAEELKNLGYKDVMEYTYTEYSILSGAQTLSQAGFSADLTGDIPFDPNMTVWEYYRLLSQKSVEDYLDNITEEQRAFAEEKNLEVDDMWYLQRVFDQVNWGDYMKESDETLRATLLEYYAADISFLRQIVKPDSQ
jgi:hypothetical protein